MPEANEGGTNTEVLRAPATPWMTYLREGVAAFIGIVIILGTLFLLWPTLSTRPISVDDAQGIFSILGGWGGVILGYYFGRMPAERSADKANEVAVIAEIAKDSAEKDMEFYRQQNEAFERRLDSMIAALEE